MAVDSCRYCVGLGTRKDVSCCTTVDKSFLALSVHHSHFCPKRFSTKKNWKSRLRREKGIIFHEFSVRNSGAWSGDVRQLHVQRVK